MIWKRGVQKLIRMLIVALHIYNQNVLAYAIHAQVGNIHYTFGKSQKYISPQKAFFLKTDINQNLISVDCRWSDWTQGECSVTCGDGVRQNHRFKEQVELYGGARCEGVAAQTKACINRICPGENKCKTGKAIWAKRMSLIFILRRYLCVLEQCCEANNVPQKCLGLCVKDQDVGGRARSAFTTICDRFTSIVKKCTIEEGGIQYTSCI